MVKEMYRELKYAKGEHRKFIGDKWDEIGSLQFEFMKKNGLKPNHKFLDIGCGCLRLGVKLIPYLNKGNYHGMDLLRSLIDDGIKHEIDKDMLNCKKPVFLSTDGFLFEKLDTKFDFLMAQSVFTHIPLNQIILCLINARKVMKDDAVFFATFFESEKTGDIVLKDVVPGTTTFLTSDPYHQHLSFFQYISDSLGYDLEYIGDWNHPRKQMMLAFRKNKKN